MYQWSYIWTAASLWYVNMSMFSVSDLLLTYKGAMPGPQWTMEIINNS